MFGQLGYLISESFRGWKQHRTVILPSLLTIFLCSLLLAASFTALGVSFKLLSVEKSLYVIEAFLNENVPEDSIAVIQTRLEHTRHVESVSFVSADSALVDFSNHFSPDMLELVEGNPIPAFFRVSLSEEARNPADLSEVRNTIAEEAYFEEVQAPIKWASRIASWKFKMIFWPICISILLLITLSLIICNSVRLSLMSRKLLVENMKYAGGSYLFIEFPFVLEGAMQGFLGSGVAILLLGLVIRSLVQMFPIVASGVDYFGIVALFTVLLETMLAGYFSFRTVRSFLFEKKGEQE
ncbi:permease-like cell division protein FtsX [uncultured Fibrobacter sp.]|uniref:cell division protein FtsX n=1 Tax=uncultured Fibrobacter sp. TaxID=261512 RepID=UPI0025E5983D|nr:permease-like cell division protein FtsX [uncultured Fibrobacter sp.]